MNSDEASSNYLYAVITRPCWFEPFVAIETEAGLRMLPAALAGVEISSDGPCGVSSEAIELANSKGVTFSNNEVHGLWSARFANDFLETIFKTQDSDEDCSILEGEIDWQTRTPKPSDDLSLWLKKSKNWHGSSSAIFADSEGKMAGAFVTLFTSNPYKLAMLLTWLGVPKKIIAGVTGIDPASDA